jgi:hypothetical protein
MVNTCPDWLELLVLEEAEVLPADLWNLVPLAERISERHCVAVHGDIANCGARVLVAPNGPSRVDPGRVGGVAVVCD